MPITLTGRPIEWPELQLVVDFSWGPDDRLYLVVVRRASQHVPRAVLRNAANVQLQIVQARDDPSYWLVPLFPDAGTVGRSRLAVADPADEPALRGIDLLLSTSRRIVALVVPDAHRRLALP